MAVFVSHVVSDINYQNSLYNEMFYKKEVKDMEFLMVFLIYPIIVLAASVIGFLVIRRWFVMPLLTFVVFTLLTFTVLNESFFIWVVVYTILSVIVSLIMKFIKKGIYFCE